MRLDTSISDGKINFFEVYPPSAPQNINILCMLEFISVSCWIDVIEMFILYRHWAEISPGKCE
jgi:hypothetical protein